MLKNYFKTAWRNLRKNKVFSLVNVAGMAVGTACFILLGLYIWNELGYDRFHKNADRIARVKMLYQYGDGEKVDVAVTPTALVPDLLRNVPEIESGVRVYRLRHTVQLGEKKFNEDKFLYADSSFFDMFSFAVSRGNRATLLDEPNSVVLTEETARKYFDNADPVGKQLLIDDSRIFKVTGVVKEIPSNSQIKFDFIASFSSLEQSKNEVWHSANYISYVLLNRNTSIPALQKKIDQRIDKLMQEFGEGSGRTRFELEPLTRVHLYSTAEGPEPGGNIRYVYLLGIIAVLQLLISAINFMNLSTAKSARRMREIGVRKTMGAQRKQLFGQFMSESAVVTFASLVLGLLLAFAAMPFFNQLTGRELSIDKLLSPWSIGALFLLLLLVTFLAGTWPAVVLSAFRPVTALAGKKQHGQAGGTVFRNGLVVFQFAVSAFFIAATLIVSKQLHYMQEKKLGLERQQVLVIDERPGDKLDAFKNALLQHTAIMNVTASTYSPVHIEGGYVIYGAEGKSPDFEMSVTAMPVEKDFLKTLGIKLVAGRDLNKNDALQANPATDTTRYFHFIINQAAAKALGWTAAQAIGRKMNLHGRSGEICGVVEDFHFASMHQSIAPLVIFPENDYLKELLVKVAAGNLETTIGNIEKTWHSFFPATPFEYHFLDEDFDSLYRNEAQFRRVLTLFTSLAIFVACLGLFGLAAITVVQRTKEIGVRKVLGASAGGIVVLLSGDFVKLVLLAVIIAAPLAWLTMDSWLQDFAYRIDIQWWIFALTAGLAVLIALLTVSLHSVKAALVNPVRSLRSE